MDDWRSYDGVATIYARVHAPRFAEPARDLIRLAEVRPGMRVLDVGTGTGVAARAATETGAHAVGVDASLAMLAAADADGDAPPEWVAAEAIDLPFREATFDATTGNFVLAHFARVETALFDIVRVTKPGGKLAFSSWADAADAFQQTWNELIESVVPKELLAPSVSQVVPGHDRFANQGVVQQTLMDAGLRHVRVERAEYEWRYSQDEYLEGLEVWAAGRFVRGMLGEAEWASFLERARATFADRFADPLHDRRDVLLAVGTKP